ncbi:amino acid/polyamine transporter I [Umbelopsis sp. PMI_123]|nr:amino acid/polyamine transporter I [Umbelopsis sp. PMI_123]
MAVTDYKVGDHQSDFESFEQTPVTENDATSSTDDPIGHHIGLFGAVTLILGRVVGSGIFASPGPLFAAVNSVGMALVLWTITGMITAVGALAYAELATSFPASGGEYIYLRKAFGPLRKNPIPFVFAWAASFVAFPLAMASIANVFAKYLLYLAYYHPGMAADKIPSPPNYAVKLVAVASIWAVTILNMISRSSGNYVQNVTTVAKFIGLIIICIVGIVWLAKGTYLFQFQNAFEGSSSTFWPYGTGIYLALFSYNGWNNATYSTGELRNPRRNVPLAVVISTLIVTVIYVWTNIAYFATLPVDIVKTSSVTALNVGVATMGPPGAYILTIFVMFSTFGTINGNMFSASRVVVATAQNGILLPKFLAYVHPTRKTPIVALAVVAVITSALTAPGDFTFLSKMVTLVQWIFYCAAVIGLCYMRLFHSERLQRRAIKVPLPLLLIFVIIAAFLVVAPFIGAATGYIQYVIVVAVVALAFPIWVVRVLFGINGGGGKEGVAEMEAKQNNED